MERTKLLILRITNRCNLSCRYCYAQPGDKCKSETDKNIDALLEEKDFGLKQITDMPLETARKAIDLLAKPGEKLKIQFTGGEPLLCIEMMQSIFQYVKQRGIQTGFSVQTNGTLLTKENCQILKKIQCAVGVSLDGIGEANSHRIYPDKSPAFQDTIEGIRNLAQEGMACNINAVINSANQDKLGELIELAAFLGNVKGVGLDMFRPMGRGQKENYAPCSQKLSQNIIELLEKQKKLSHLGVTVRIKELEKIRIMLTEQKRENCYCYAQTKDSIAVDPYGDIYPCSSLVGVRDMWMGNIENITSLEHSKDDGVRNFSEDKKENGIIWPKVPGTDYGCQSCEVKEFCQGGCPAGRVACKGRNEADCIMHRTIIGYGRKEYA